MRRWLVPALITLGVTAGCTHPTAGTGSTGGTGLAGEAFARAEPYTAPPPPPLSVRKPCDVLPFADVAKIYRVSKITAVTYHGMGVDACNYLVNGKPRADLELYDAGTNPGAYLATEAGGRPNSRPVKGVGDHAVYLPMSAGSETLVVTVGRRAIWLRSHTVLGTTGLVKMARIVLKKLK